MQSMKRPSGKQFAAPRCLARQAIQSIAERAFGEDQYIRRLLVAGMTSRGPLARTHPERTHIWTANIIAEKPFRLVAVAMANKTARVIWALLAKGSEFQAPVFIRAADEMQDE